MEENWETCKENVQPIRTGRNVTQLNRLLNVRTNTSVQDERNRRRDEFEGMLRSDPEHPLDVWFDYVNWIEKSYPEGGEESHLNKVLENCIGELYGDERYKQDSRFLHIFLKYVNNIGDQLETFQMIHTAGLFTSLAVFYGNWSDRLKETGDFRKAEQILQDGLKNGAKPHALLVTALERLKIAAAAAAAEQDQEEEAEKERMALISLKTKKKAGKTTAPVERIKNYTQDKFRLPETEPSSSRRPNAMISIFNDENEPALADGLAGHVASKIVINNQENDRKAGRWCDQKIKPKVKPVPSNDAKPAFGIFEDVQTEEEIKAAQVKPLVDNCALRPLKKHEKSPKLCLEEKLSANQRFFCDMKRIYTGCTEFSFEEIRYKKMLAAKRKEEEEAAKRKMVEEVAELKKTLLGKAEPVKDLKEDLAMLKQQVGKLMQSNPETAKEEEDECNEEKITPKEDLTIVQNLWNGSLEGDDEDEGGLGSPAVMKSNAPQNKDFSIYKDMTAIGEVEEAPGTRTGSMFPDVTINNPYKNYSDADTIALPRNKHDFVAMCSSTPAPYRASGSRQEEPQNFSINPFSCQPTGKLSPIVETSKEYKSSSSSSSSGINSTYRYRTFGNSKHHF